ncbi:MAG: hypothetical protein MJ137_04070 [Clostridia bacterium]|nr:hypothetical protein [Clostridia bacterium]
MNNTIDNRNCRAYENRGRRNPKTESASETYYDRLVLQVVKFMRWFNSPIVRAVVALFTIAFALAAFTAYAIAFLSGTINFLTGILLVPVMVGIIGLAAKSLS